MFRSRIRRAILEHQADHPLFTHPDGRRVCLVGPARCAVVYAWLGDTFAQIFSSPSAELSLTRRLQLAGGMYYLTLYWRSSVVDDEFSTLTENFLTREATHCILQSAQALPLLVIIYQRYFPHFPFDLSRAHSNEVENLWSLVRAKFHGSFDIAGLAAYLANDFVEDVRAVGHADVVSRPRSLQGSVPVGTVDVAAVQGLQLPPSEKHTWDHFREGRILACAFIEYLGLTEKLQAGDRFNAPASPTFRATTAADAPDPGSVADGGDGDDVECSEEPPPADGINLEESTDLQFIVAAARAKLHQAVAEADGSTAPSSPESAPSVAPSSPESAPSVHAPASPSPPRRAGVSTGDDLDNAVPACKMACEGEDEDEAATLMDVGSDASATTALPRIGRRAGVVILAPDGAPCRDAEGELRAALGKSDVHLIAYVRQSVADMMAGRASLPDRAYSTLVEGRAVADPVLTRVWKDLQLQVYALTTLQRPPWEPPDRELYREKATRRKPPAPCGVSCVVLPSGKVVPAATIIKQWSAKQPTSAPGQSRAERWRGGDERKWTSSLLASDPDDSTLFRPGDVVAVVLPDGFAVGQVQFIITKRGKLWQHLAAAGGQQEFFYRLYCFHTDEEAGGRTSYNLCEAHPVWCTGQQLMRRVHFESLAADGRAFLPAEVAKTARQEADSMSHRVKELPIPTPGRSAAKACPCESGLKFADAYHETLGSHTAFETRFTVADLQMYCRHHGVAGYGGLRKRDLISLVVAHIAGLLADDPTATNVDVPAGECSRCVVARSAPTSKRAAPVPPRKRTRQLTLATSRVTLRRAGPELCGLLEGQVGVFHGVSLRFPERVRSFSLQPLADAGAAAFAVVDAPAELCDVFALNRLPRKQVLLDARNAFCTRQDDSTRTLRERLRACGETWIDDDRAANLAKLREVLGMETHARFPRDPFGVELAGVGVVLLTDLRVLLRVHEFCADVARTTAFRVWFTRQCGAARCTALEKRMCAAADAHACNTPRYAAGGDTADIVSWSAAFSWVGTQFIADEAIALVGRRLARMCGNQLLFLDMDTLNAIDPDRGKSDTQARRILFNAAKRQGLHPDEIQATTRALCAVVWGNDHWFAAVADVTTTPGRKFLYFGEGFGFPLPNVARRAMARAHKLLWDLVVSPLRGVRVTSFAAQLDGNSCGIMALFAIKQTADKLLAGRVPADAVQWSFRFDEDLYSRTRAACLEETLLCADEAVESPPFFLGSLVPNDYESK